MKQAKTTAALVLGGLLAASAWAQDTTVMAGTGTVRTVPDGSASVTSNVPAKAGEASTMTNGVPNVATHNPTTDERVVMPLPLEVSSIPTRAGEASTMVGGNPNADPMNPIYRR